MSTPEEILEFWLDETGPKGWYDIDPDRDARIRDTFHEAWQNARDGAYSIWMTYPSGALAYIILTDQFPRNMFRDSPDAFATDRISLAVAKAAVGRNWDMRIDEPARQFFYLPMMHSESISDQERCIRLLLTRMPETGENNLLHAKAHRDVIRQFGRFPYRNEVLDRPHTDLEIEYLAQGGYGSTVQALSA